MRKSKKAHQLTTHEERAKVIGEGTSFHITEAYKATRTNIMFSLPGEGCKTIAITSAFPEEGKSTTCVNLAISFAQTGKKVLVMDCDMRKPTIHRKIDVVNDKGISHVISGMCKLENEVVWATPYENLDVMPAGHVPPNPAELLSSNSMKHMMEELEKRYDYIFIDTPPLNLVTDATILAPMVSGTVVVVRQDVTKHKDLQDALEKLNFVGAKVLGVVLHDMKQGKGGRYGKYSKYSKYAKYSKYGYKSTSVTESVN